MKTVTKKKTSGQKKALVCAVVLAVVIAMGATFAWFTSTDEVTNELSASNDYNVTLAETFTPTTQLTPGQNVTKEVAAVNTGTVASFVKLDLTDTLALTYETALYDANNNNEKFTTAAPVTVPSNALTLDTTATIADGNGNAYSEVQALQAGGQLVYAASGSNYSVGYVSSYDFTPDVEGVYIFERTDGSYVGYYFDGNDTYYEIDNITYGPGTDYSYTFVQEVTVDPAKVTFSDTIYLSGTDTPTYGTGYTDADGVYYIQAVYDPDGTANLGDEIIMNIALNGDWFNNGDFWSSYDWTGVYDDATDTWTFYYLHILSAGTTSELLVTDMQLDESVSQDAYTSFTYDLVVGLDSVQVVTVDANTAGVGQIELPSSSLTWDFDATENTWSGDHLYVDATGTVCGENGTAITSLDENRIWWDK
ncbi:MAG: BsaA family SipW-dependent biofilm matrix protein [Ruminococcus sp.]|nr:BsaA family SipW-dependent biofilm matrix protein [Ruminococcus sp.]